MTADAPITVSTDQIDPTHTERGDHEFTRRQLGAATAADALGCSHYEIPPNRRTWLTHYHAGNEEALYVLDGSGTVALGPGGEEHDLEPGDYATFTADEAGTHDIRAGDDGLTALAFSTMEEPDITVYPEVGKVGLFAGSAPGRSEGRILSKTLDLHADVPYWEDEADDESGDTEDGDEGHDGLRETEETGVDTDLSKRVVNQRAVDPDEYDHGERRFRRKRLAAAAGGEALGCSLHEVEPGAKTWPAHYHTANEEAIYVLDGEVTLSVGSERDDRSDRTAHVLGPGDFAALPTGPEYVREVEGETAGHGDSARYLAVSTMIEPAFTVLPDAGAVHLMAGGAPGNYEDRYVSKTLDLNAEIDYWDA